MLGRSLCLARSVLACGNLWQGACAHSPGPPLPLRCLPSRPEEPSTWSGYMGKMLTAATNYLPAQVSDMMNQDRAFATGRLNFSGQKNICTLSTYVQCHQTHRCMFPGHRVPKCMGREKKKKDGVWKIAQWLELFLLMQRTSSRSAHTSGGSLLPVTPVLEGSRVSDALFWPQHACGTYTDRQAHIKAKERKASRICLLALTWIFWGQLEVGT